MARPASRLDRWESGTRRVLPRPAAFLLFGELRLFEAVWPLASRRYDIHAGETGIGYARGRLPIATVPWSSISVVRVHRRCSADESRLTHDAPLPGTNLDIELNEPLT